MSDDGKTPGSNQDETYLAITAAEHLSVRDPVFGPYRLLERIGEGGMGEVWLAEQQQPIRRRVAVKFIKAGMDTREVVARFQYERQALASMEHPAIARVFDAGSTSQGRPYFVMEYVKGVPITLYCDRHNLTTRERLALFMQVCAGVQHAHQKAILHRDLKPSNILVAETDGRPSPKIIDFGVAKAVSQGLAGETAFTRAGSLLGTPQYMSPEQAFSGGEDIDTRSDIYSLGVVLYELLVGAPPLDLSQLPLDRMLKALREEESLKPSTKIRLSPESAASATHRSTNVGALRKELRGDLDAIALKALAKDRARRYESAAGLALDIDRYLHNEPIAARPASVLYSANKYFRRHRFAISAVAALLLLLGLFAFAQRRQLQRTARERDRADRVTAFMTRMFKVSNPSESRGSKVTAREILDKASGEIDGGLAKDPEMRSEMQQVMGTVYWNLGLYSRGEALLRKALASRRRLFGPGDPKTLQSMDTLARVLMDSGQYPEAERLHRQTLAARRQTLGENNADTIASMSGLANALGVQAHYPESERLQQKAYEWLRAERGPGNIETLRAMDNLGTTMNLESHYPQAAAIHKQALEIAQRALGNDHIETLRMMANLASDMGGMQQFAEALRLDQEALQMERRTLGPEYPDTLRSMSAVADDLDAMGRFDEAEKALRETRTIQQRVLGPNHPDTAVSTYELALVSAKLGRSSEALSLLRDAIHHGLSAAAMATVAGEPAFESLHGNAEFQEIAADVAHRLSSK